MSAARAIATRCMLAAIRGYQLLLSPWLGRACRFVPTCSEYTALAIQHHGPLRGAWLGARRICRCHPWGGSGYDPVPGLDARAEPRKRRQGAGLGSG